MVPHQEGLACPAVEGPAVAATAVGCVAGGVCNFFIAFWRVKVLFLVPHEPLAPLWVARLCRAKYCNCNCNGCPPPPTHAAALMLGCCCCCCRHLSSCLLGICGVVGVGVGAVVRSVVVALLAVPCRAMHSIMRVAVLVVVLSCTCSTRRACHTRNTSSKHSKASNQRQRRK
jgi:hypothetical protein